MQEKSDLLSGQGGLVQGSLTGLHLKNIKDLAGIPTLTAYSPMPMVAPHFE